MRTSSPRRRLVPWLALALVLLLAACGGRNGDDAPPAAWNDARWNQAVWQ